MYSVPSSSTIVPSRVCRVMAMVLVLVKVLLHTRSCLVKVKVMVKVMVMVMAGWMLPDWLSALGNRSDRLDSFFQKNGMAPP